MSFNACCQKNSHREKPISTKILDYRQLVELQPAHSLWLFYDPAQAPLRFNASRQLNFGRNQCAKR